MDSALEKTYLQNENNLNDWVGSINQWLKTSRNVLNDRDEEYRYALSQIVKTFAQMLEVFASFGRFKDAWEEPTFFTHAFGLEVQIKSKKTSLTFEIGTDYEGLYFQSYLSHGQNLKNMNDQFWKKFLELSKCGSFEFKENAIRGNGSKDYSHLFRTYKGNLFRLMRNYILFKTDGEDNNLDLGWLFMRWDYETSISDILKNGCKAFKIMYQLNYALWKVSDLKLKREAAIRSSS